MILASGNFSIYIATTGLTYFISFSKGRFSLAIVFAHARAEIRKLRLDEMAILASNIFFVQLILKQLITIPSTNRSISHAL